MNISIEQLEELNSDQLIELHNAYCEDSEDYSNIIQSSENIVDSIGEQKFNDLKDVWNFFDKYKALTALSVYGYKFTSAGFLEPILHLDIDVHKLQKWLAEVTELEVSAELEEKLRALRKKARK